MYFFEDIFLHDMDSLFVACIGCHVVDDLIDQGDMFPIFNFPDAEHISEFFVVLEPDCGLKN